LQVSTSAVDGSLLQNFGLASVSGQPFAASGWFRAGSATPVSVRFCAWQDVNGAFPACQDAVVTNAGWVRLSTISQTTLNASTMRVQAYVRTLNAPLLVDTVSAFRTGDVAPPSTLPPVNPNNFQPIFSGEAIFGSWFGQKQYSRLRFELPPSLTGASVNSAVMHTYSKNCDHLSAAAGNQQLSQYANPIHIRKLVADFDTTPEAVQGDRTVLVPGYTAYADADVTDYVKSWAADPGSNYGVRLDMGDIAGGNYGYCKVFSRSAESIADPNKTTWLEITYNEPPAATKRFHPVSPVTIMNSGTGVGTASTNGAGFVQARAIGVTGGAAGVPVTGVPASGVSAVAVSITVRNRDTTVPAVAPGAVMVYPNGPRPGNAVETHYSAGATVAANQAVVPIGQDGKIAVDVLGASGDVQVDLTGWFDDGTAATAAGGLRYQPLVGERIADTRYGSGGTLVANTVRLFAVRGQGGVPLANVGAAALQVHGFGTGPARIKVWASGEPEPSDTAALILRAGADQRSALVFAKLGADGQINVKSTATINVAVDAMGYFTSVASAGAGFQPVAAKRILDTRFPVDGGVPISDVDLRVSDGAGVGAVLVNVIAYNPGGAALVDVYPSGESHDNFDTMLIDGPSQVATSSLAFVRPSADGRIHVNVWPVSTHIVVDLLGYAGTADTVGLSAGNQIRNGSFEVGSASWQTNTACGDGAGAVSFTTVTPPAAGTDRADDGNTYARVVSTSATVPGSFCQNVNRAAPNGPKPQELYTVNFRVRSAPGQPAGRGVLELWELGSADPVTGQLDSVSVKEQFITSSTWTEKTMSMCASKSTNFTLRTKIYPYGTSPIDVDNVRLTSTTSASCQLFDSFPVAGDLNSVAAAPASNLPGGSFDFLEERWGNCRSSAARYLLQGETGLANFSHRPTQAYGSRGGYMATNVTAVGGNRLCRNFLGAPLNGNTPQTFTVWVRSEDGSNVQSAIEISGHIRQFDGSCGGGGDVSGCGSSFPATVERVVNAGSIWKQVSVTWWPPNLSQGAGTYPDTFSIAVRPLVAGKTILFDEATQIGPFGANSCQSWSSAGCTITGGAGPGGTTTFPVFPLLSDVPGEIHDPAYSNCLALASPTTVSIVSTSVPENCTIWTSTLVPAGLRLSEGPEGPDCMTRTGNDLLAAPCVDSPGQIFQDRLVSGQTNVFVLGNQGSCLSRLPTLQFVACDETNQAQHWSDSQKIKMGTLPVYLTALAPQPGSVVQLPLASWAWGGLNGDCLANSQVCETIVSGKHRFEFTGQAQAARELYRRAYPSAWSSASGNIPPLGYPGRVMWELRATRGFNSPRADLVYSGPVLRVKEAVTNRKVQLFTPSFQVWEVKWVRPGTSYWTTFSNNWFTGLAVIEAEALSYYSLLPPGQSVLGTDLSDWRRKFLVNNVYYYVWQPQAGVLLVMTSADYVTLKGNTPEADLGSFQRVF
jgi:hypothetical protein